MDQKELKNPRFYKFHKSHKKKWIILGSFVFTLILGSFIYFKITYVWSNDAMVDGYAIDSSANVLEKVIGLFVEEGDFVEKGQLLVVLQKNVPLAQKETALAKIEAFKQEILVKEAYYLKIRNDYERAIKAIQDRIISSEEFDHKEKDFQIAEAEVDLAYANLELSKKELGTIEAQLLHYEVVAAEEGIIAKRWVWLGDVIQPGQSLYTIYNLKDVWIHANIEEKQIRKVKVGSKVKIYIDAYPGRFFNGEVFSINGAAAAKFTLVPQNNATGNYTKVEQRIPIKISIKRPKDFPQDKPLYLFPGISAEVFIKSS